ncbi:MAG: carboxymuconolactone decarboxylase family protein [Sedimentitalea sp.]|nr:carboxymuconolactone decarboxylase family protein [Sedimentitalea sp.]
MSENADLHPLSDEDWPEAIADMRDGFAGDLNVYRTMAHHPALLRAWSGLSAHVVTRSSLGRALNEVVILRTGMRLGSDSEWGQHVVRARQFGLDDARIRALRGPLAGISGEDALLAGAVDELFDAQRLSPPTLAALVARHGKTGMLDLIATVGFYITLGYLLTSCATPLDDDIRESLDRDKRLAMETEALKIARDEIVLIPLHQQPMARAVSDAFSELPQFPDNKPRMWFVTK